MQSLDFLSLQPKKKKKPQLPTFYIHTVQTIKADCLILHASNSQCSMIVITPIINDGFVSKKFRIHYLL